ncbi:MAG: DNA primase [Puniceicoccales bacterium]|jgi:DNA primase|nr:DNA primase [Puniceicoccales bacterium]
MACLGRLDAFHGRRFEMSFIRRESIEALRGKVDICDVVSAYVSLRRCGAAMRALSPFTDEKTPSFFIYPERQYFHCYSSGNGGDVFRFIQLKEQLTFAEAVEFLAEKYDFKLEHESGTNIAKDATSDKRTLLAIHEVVGKFFREAFLAATGDGHRARVYWTQHRKFSLDAAERYGIGVAPCNYGTFLDKLRRQFSHQSLVASGLFVANDKNSTEIFPRFQGRLMIPIRDVHGKTIAFTGRSVDGMTPEGKTADAKYVNSPGTPIFQKGSLLFAIDLARSAVNEVTPFLLVEGQIDCLRCHECSISTAVASQGTAITAQHLHLLHRYALEIVCVLDGDRAGRDAAIRMIPLALAESVNLRFVTLPQGQDPDSFLLEHGPEAIRELIGNAKSIMQILVDYHLSKSKCTSQAHREHAMRRIFAAIREVPSRVSELEFLRQLAGLTGMGLEELKADYFNTRPNIPEVSLPKGDELPYDAAGNLLRLLIMEPEYAAAIAQVVDERWVEASAAGKLLNRILGEVLNENSMDDILQCLAPEEQSAIGKTLLDGKKSEDPLKEINECIKTIYDKYIENEIIKITRQIENESGEDFQELIRHRWELKQALREPPTIVRTS